MRDSDDRCSPRRCFLACLGCGCFCLALPTVAGLFSGGTSVGAAEHAHAHHAHHNATRGAKPPT